VKKVQETLGMKPLAQETSEACGAHHIVF